MLSESPSTQFNPEIKSALALLGFSLAALVWANSNGCLSYDQFWEFKFFDLSLRHTINHGWMTFFFFLVGLELKRECLTGELASIHRAILPLVSALGGMIVPATIYAGFTWGTPAMSGWGIPMATDIAFALGALAFFGRKLPGSLRIFLTALAVLDDLGSIVLIAFFYTQKINLWALTAATLFAFLLWKVAKAGEPKLRHFALLGFMLWLALFKSGVQPTLAGVITAFAIPTHLPALEKLENFLKPWVNYGIIPAFAIANAGISFSNENSVQLLNPICMGVLFGLLIGKPIGILLFAFLGTQFNLTRLPHGVSWMQFAGVAALGGIGFTVSIFVAQLTFTENFLLSEAKLGILLASFIATVAGGLALRVASHLKLDSSLPIK